MVSVDWVSMKIRIEAITDDGTIFRGDATLTRAKATRIATKPSVKGGKVKCPEAISGLWRNGKFKSPATFADVKTSLSHAGFNFPDNTLMMALTNAPYLTKRGAKRSYQ